MDGAGIKNAAAPDDVIGEYSAGEPAVSETFTIDDGGLDWINPLFIVIPALCVLSVVLFSVLPEPPVLLELVGHVTDSCVSPRFIDGTIYAGTKRSQSKAWINGINERKFGFKFFTFAFIGFLFYFSESLDWLSYLL